MKKVLITGASGLLGRKLATKLSDLFDVLAPSKIQYNSINPHWHDCLDISNKDAVYHIIKKFKPDVVVNCAAFTDVDKSETKKSLARDVNVKGLLNIIKSLPLSSKIIHISTDYVFDGQSGDYREDDMKSPVNYYGKTKLEADNLLMGSNSNHLIIRPNVLYSSDNTPFDHVLGGKRYIKHFVSWICDSLSNNKKVKVVDDQISNPVYVPDLVDVITTSILVDYTGVCHYGSEDAISRYDFAIKVCEIFDPHGKFLDRDKILPINSSELKQVALRPKKTSLNCQRIVRDLNIELYTTDYSLNRICSNK